MRRTAATATSREQSDSTEEQVRAALRWLERRGTRKTRDEMARYGLPSATAYGVPVGAIKQFATQLGRNHDLALALWDTNRYEARLLASFVGDPARVTPAEMDRWCRDFDNWGTCDTACFHLFDRSPHAWARIAPWARRRDEFQKRGGFVLLACLALHDKTAPDESLAKCLPLIERGATDDRNFVKKGVSWALRSIGRRNPPLHAAAVATARRLTESHESAAQWVGKDALKELSSPAVTRRLTARAPAGAATRRQR
jgi:3-methyladenine DNA glycosylase AlkD